MKVTVSDTAKISLSEIVDFLKVKWTIKEITVLKTDIKKFKQTIVEGIIKHQSVENYPNIKYTLIGKRNVMLFYEVKTDNVIIKLFWHCKRNPQKLQYFLRNELK